MRLCTGYLSETSNTLTRVFLLDGKIVSFKYWLLCAFAEFFREHPEWKKYYESEATDDK